MLANITYMPTDYRSSSVQSYYISVQREIAANMTLDVAYVGNKSSGLLLFANYNQAYPNNSAGTIPLASRRPIPEFGDITYAFNGGKSKYDALQLKYQYRMRKGLMVLNSFTWSKAKDNGAGLAREPERQLPVAAELLQPRGRLRHLGVRRADQQHAELRLPAPVRQAAEVDGRCQRRRTGPGRRLDGQRHRDGALG